MIPSKQILNQGACGEIVHMGTIQEYKGAKISFVKGQIVGMVSNENNSWLIMNIERFGCNLYADKLNKSEEIPAKDLLEPENPKPTKNNK